MLEYLELTGVGPAEHMRVDFAPRLNILTGDNGLGKTFVLDVAWWVLTGRLGRPCGTAERGFPRRDCVPGADARCTS